MKLKTIIKNSLFLTSIRLAKSNPSKIALMVLFDVAFILSFFYILPTLAKYFVQSIFIAPTQAFALIFSFFSVAYNLIILLGYSFFKYCVLDYIKSLFEKTEIQFNRLGQFYLLNIILFLPTFLLFSLILSSIKEIYRPFVLIALGIPISLLLYTTVNLSHSFFYQGASIKESIKKGLEIAFTKLKVYRETVLVMILSALILGLLFFGIGKAISLIASKDYTLYLSVYGNFKQISIIILDLIFYFVILINRISFYAIAKENK